VERVKLFLALVLLMALLGCSRNSQPGQTVEDNIIVCSAIDSEDDARRIANSTIELYDSPKESDDPVANRYPLPIADQSGKFKLKAVVPSRQYCLAIVPKAACVSMAEQEARRIPVTTQRRAHDTECQDNIRVFLDAGCNLRPN
jgi:hypothetical protein